MGTSMVSHRVSSMSLKPRVLFPNKSLLVEETPREDETRKVFMENAFTIKNS